MTVAKHVDVANETCAQFRVQGGTTMDKDG